MGFFKLHKILKYDIIINDIMKCVDVLMNISKYVVLCMQVSLGQFICLFKNKTMKSSSLACSVVKEY